MTNYVPGCPDPWVFACLSKLSGRAFHGSNLPFRKSRLNQLRKGGLEYEHKAGFGTTETLLETLTEIEPTTPRFHVLVLYHCVTNIGPQKRCLNTDILVQILNGETIFSNNHTLFSIQNCKVTGCNGIITTTEIWRDKQNSYFIIIFCWGGKRSLVPYLTLLKHAKQSQNGVVFIPSLFEV